MANGHTKLHQEEHQSGGLDEIAEGSLLPQDPTGHASTHLVSGSDALNNIDPVQISTGLVDNQEFNMLDGVNTASELVTKDILDSAVQGLDWQESVIDKDVSDPSTLTPSDGDRYIVGDEAVGDWSGHDKEIAEYDGDTSSWVFSPPDKGFATWVEDETVQYTYNGTDWIQFGSTVDHGALQGLNDVADHPYAFLKDGGRELEGDIVPDADGTRYLGSSTPERHFASIYAYNIGAYPPSGDARGMGITLGVQENEGSTNIKIDANVFDGGDVELTAREGTNGRGRIRLWPDAYVSLEADTVLDTDVALDATAGVLKPKIVTQEAEPNLVSGEMAVHEDDVNGQNWLIVNIGGTTYKVELAA